MKTHGETVSGNQVGVLEKVGYALGDTASNLYFQTFMIFMMFYYTDVFGIPAAAVGTMFFVVRSTDAVADPLMGMLADRTRTRFGRFRPYLLWGALPMALTGVAAFTVPQLDITGKLVYAYVTYTLVMLMYTAVNIPYGALMGVMSGSSTERTSLSSFRFIGAFAGAVFVQTFTTELVARLGGGDPALGYQLTVAFYGVLAMLMFVAAFVTTRERVEPAEVQTSFGGDLRDLAGNRPWWVMLVLGWLVLAAFSVRGGTTIYYVKYILGDGSLVGVFLAVGGVANILGVALTAPLAKLLGKKRLYVLAMALGAVLTCLFFFIPPTSLVLVFGCHIALSFVLGPTAPIVWAMYADTADYSEWRTGRRATGLVFSAATFAQKLGWGAGGVLLGALLSAFGYVPNVAQSPSSLLGIVLLMSVIPGALMFLAVGCMGLYELDDERMAVIELELAAKRALAAGATTTGASAESGPTQVAAVGVAG